MTQTATPVADATCVHHWLIAPNDTPVSRGRCLHCGTERDFNNGLEWDGGVGHVWRHLRAETPELQAIKRYHASSGSGAAAFEGLA